MEDHIREKAKRATRRSKREAKFKRVKNTIKNRWGKWVASNNQFLEEAAQRHVDNFAKCSCDMCGHRRKHEGAPVREKRILQEKPEDQLE